MTTSRSLVGIGLIVLCAACAHRDEDRVASLTEEGANPDAFVPDNLAHRSDSLLLVRHDTLMDTDEEAQPDSLPALPFGMTLDMIVAGDSIFHGNGGCKNCHGSEGQGLPARGKTLTAGLHFVGAGDWRGVDSIVSVGITDAETRSPVSMPPRGQHSDLTADEMRAVAAYVWAISSVKGEPWAGGHVVHTRRDRRASARTDIP